MPSSHAVLSPSSSSRWMACPKSIQATLDKQSETSSFAEEGTRAHALGEWKLKNALGLPAGECPEADDGEMDEATTGYMEYALEKGGTDGVYFIEQRFALDERYAPAGSCFGTTDCACVSGNTLFIIDLKYGKGIQVRSRYNSQLMIYALATYNAISSVFEGIEKVVMCVYQPRLSNCDEFELPINKLLAWGDSVLREKAYMAYEGEGGFHAGEHCRFCPIKATCRERGDRELDVFREYGYLGPDEYSLDELSSVLQQIPDFESWISDVKEWAMAHLIKGGTIPHFKLVAGKSARTIVDEEGAASALKAIDIDPYNRKLKTITELEKTLGKKKFKEVLDQFIQKKEGKPAIASEEDKRPPYITRIDAAEEFASEGADNGK